MSYQIITVPSAQKDLIKLPKKAQQQISEHIEALADDPRPYGHIKMAARTSEYRIKRGNYRVVYIIDDPGRRVVVRVIRHRKDVHR